MKTSEKHFPLFEIVAKTWSEIKWLLNFDFIPATRYFYRHHLRGTPRIFTPTQPKCNDCLIGVQKFTLVNIFCRSISAQFPNPSLSLFTFDNFRSLLPHFPHKNMA